MIPLSMREEIKKVCDNDEDERIEIVSCWMWTSPYVSWEWLGGELHYRQEKAALTAAKKYIRREPGGYVLPGVHIGSC